MIDKDKIIVKLYLKTEEQAEALFSLQKQYDDVKTENSKLRGQHAQVLAKESAQNTLKADLDMLRSQVSQLKSQNGELERALKSASGERESKKNLKELIIKCLREACEGEKPYLGKKYNPRDLVLMFENWAKKENIQINDTLYDFTLALYDLDFKCELTENGQVWSVGHLLMGKIYPDYKGAFAP